VCARANNPGLAFQCQGAAVQAKAANIPYVEEKVDVPITDYASLVTRLAQEAGTSGAVVPGFTEDQLVQLFPAVEQQGLIDATHWYEGATGSSSNVMAALGSAWDGKYFAQSEYNPPETGQGPDTENYRAVSAKYIPKDALSNFGEFGYTAGLMMTEAMLKVVQDGQELNQANVNAAVRNLVNIPTDLLCKPWYFGDLNSHLPNNASYFTTPKDGKAALLQPDCVTDPLTDPIITQALLDEKTLGLPQLPDTPSEADLQAALQQFSSGS
jgi:branched-chain amino acid transport system substrate-binding protein